MSSEVRPYHYHYFPGDPRPIHSMASTLLLTRGGKCDQYAALEASLAYDTVGGVDRVFVRFYPPNRYGIAHVSPIVVERGVEYDIFFGGQAFLAGTRVAAIEYVRSYARHNGIEVPNELFPAPVVGPQIPISDGVPPTFAEHGVSEFDPNRIIGPGIQLPLFVQVPDRYPALALDYFGLLRPQTRFPSAIDLARAVNFEYEPLPAYVRDASPPINHYANIESQARDIEATKRLVERETDPIRKAAGLGILSALYLGILHEFEDPSTDNLRALRDRYSLERHEAIIEGERTLTGVSTTEIDQLVQRFVTQYSSTNPVTPTAFLFLGNRGDQIVLDYVTRKLSSNPSDAFIGDLMMGILNKSSTRARAIALLLNQSRSTRQSILYTMTNQSSALGIPPEIFMPEYTLCGNFATNFINDIGGNQLKFTSFIYWFNSAVPANMSQSDRLGYLTFFATHLLDASHDHFGQNRSGDPNTSYPLAYQFCLELNSFLAAATTDPQILAFRTRLEQVISRGVFTQNNW